MKEDFDIKAFIQSAAFMFVISGMIVFFIYLGNQISKTNSYERMDARELQYDADGEFILIDQTEGLCGVYRATEPLYHFRIKINVKPGVYKLYLYEDWIELHDNTSMLFSYIEHEDIKKLKEILVQGTKTLVY